MPSFPAIVFLIAAIACSIVGRGLLVRAAFRVGPGWGVSVMLVPFAPMFFRFSYRELAESGRYWRIATMPLIALFFLTQGSPLVRDPHLPVPRKLVSAAIAEAKSSPVAMAATPVASTTSLLAKPLIAQAAPPSLDERVAANRREFENLAEWYGRLHLERGYLLKADTAGIAAYNAETVKYQAALAKARAEEAELRKMATTK